MLTRAKNALIRPRRTFYKLWAWWNSSGLFNRYEKLARSAGLDDVFFILSLDCDTPRDTEVVLDVHQKLTNFGVEPIYAVPGELLAEEESTYKKLLNLGGKFINHGYKTHTYYDEKHGEYRSCFFYDERSDDEIRNDIKNGHRSIQDILGITPKGFRTPHFGRYQRPSQLKFIHQILSKLDYRYSSSTDPYYTFRFGPIFREFGLAEVPVTGSKSYPLNILDTWNYFQEPSRNQGTEDFLKQVRKILNCYRKLECGVINLYADPSHIHEERDFYVAIEHLNNHSVNTSYDELLDGAR